MNEPKPESFESYARRLWIIFGAVVCVTLIMVATSFAHLPNPGLRIGLILACASVNAVLVAGYLMHLFSERKMIYTLLIFTVFFFVMLMFLTILHPFDMPRTTQLP
jgi:caa(3)-type oxidase subunit IV